MTPYQFGIKCAEELGANTRALVGKLRSDGIQSGKWTMGPGGSTAVNVQYANQPQTAPAKPQPPKPAQPAQPVTQPPKPAPKPAPALSPPKPGVVTRKSKSAF